MARLAQTFDDVPGALWNRARIEETRWPAHRNVPELIRIVIAIDPALSSGDEADETGIIVWPGVTRPPRQSPAIYASS
jgi:phage terminase large subunit-like protein